MGLSKVCCRCQACPYLSTCDHKEMEGVAFLESAGQIASAPLTFPLRLKHDYRDIKVAENTTVTIDLEEIKEKLKINLVSGLLKEVTP